MKRTYSLLCMLLLCSTAVFAQQPAGRTVTTIVADVLAQMPAQRAGQYNDQMKDLASTGKEGVLQLVKTMNPVGEGSNAHVEYALSGLSHYVSAEGMETERLATSNAYIKALDVAVDREAKAFVIRQLGLIGKDEAVAKLTACLDDESLREPALAALTLIGAVTPRKLFPRMFVSASAARTSELYHKINGAKGNSAKIAKLLQKALKSDDRKYRYAALEFASDHTDGDRLIERSGFVVGAKPYDTYMYGRVVSMLAKSKPAARADILNWLAQECDYPEKRAAIGLLANDAAIGYLASGDPEVMGAAAGLLVKTADTKAIAALAGLLSDADPATVEMAASALASAKGGIASAVAPMIATANPAGKVAVLQLLAGRKSEADSDVVFGQLNSASPEVQAAAYAALKDVASTGDLDKLYSLLETAAPENVPSVQQAIVHAIRLMPEAQQYSTVLSRMEHTSRGKQYLYYPVLASTGERKALDLVADRFNGETGAAKDAAFQALLSWNDINVADKLLAIAKNPSESAYSDRAIDRYIRLVSAQQLSAENRRVRLTDALEIAHTNAQKNVILSRLANTNSYLAMLKAGEYLDDAPLRQAAAGTVMTIALANKQYTGARVEELLNKVIEVLDNPDADYQRQAIRKHLDEMVRGEPFRLPAREQQEGFKVLFDGTNMNEWTGNTADYRLENGTISLYPSRGSGGNLYSAREYGNFVLRFEFELTAGANNGVGIRTEQGKDAAYHGMEIQILDHDAPIYRNIAAHQVHGSVYGVIAAKRALLKPAGEWNYEEIVADGDRIKVTLNGEVIVDGNIREAAKDGTVDKQQHPGLFNGVGYIGFLGHGSRVKFRNIRIKELP